MKVTIDQGTMIKKPKSFLLNLIALLTFFPFFKILPIVAEIQPIGATVALSYTIVFDLRSKKRRKIYQTAYLYLLVVFI